MKPFQTILNAFKIKSQQILALLFAAVFTIIHSSNHNVNCKWVPSYCHCGVIWKKTRVMCGEAQVSLLLTRVQQIQSHKQWKNKSSCFRGCITINQENLRSLIRSHIPQTCLCYRQWVNWTLTSCNSNSALIIFLCQSKPKSKSEQLSPDPLLPHLPSLCSLFFDYCGCFFSSSWPLPTHPHHLHPHHPFSHVSSQLPFDWWELETEKCSSAGHWRPCVGLALLPAALAVLDIDSPSSS